MVTGGVSKYIFCCGVSDLGEAEIRTVHDSVYLRRKIKKNRPLQHFGEIKDISLA